MVFRQRTNARQTRQHEKPDTCTAASVPRTPRCANCAKIKSDLFSAQLARELRSARSRSICPAISGSPKRDRVRHARRLLARKLRALDEPHQALPEAGPLVRVHFVRLAFAVDLEVQHELDA